MHTPRSPSNRKQPYRALVFFMLLLAFLSPPFSFSLPASSAFRFCPAIAAVLTDTSVDLPCAPAPDDESFATCASAALQSADASVMAYLCMEARYVPPCAKVSLSPV